jgi:integrase
MQSASDDNLTLFELWKEGQSETEEWKRRNFSNTVKRLCEYMTMYKLTPMTVSQKNLENYIISNWSRINKNAAVSSVKDFFEFLHEKGLIDKDPAANLPTAKQILKGAGRRAIEPPPSGRDDDAIITALNSGFARMISVLEAGFASLRNGSIPDVTPVSFKERFLATLTESERQHAEMFLYLFETAIKPVRLEKLDRDTVAGFLSDYTRSASPTAVAHGKQILAKLFAFAAVGHEDTYYKGLLKLVSDAPK